MYDPHSILGISASASKEEAKRAYRKKASEHHPDKGGDQEAFKRIQGAWEMIDNGLCEAQTLAPPPKSSFTSPEPAFKGSYDDPYSPWYTTQKRSEPPKYSPYGRQNPYGAPTPPRPKASPPRPTAPKIVQAYATQERERKNLGDFIARVSMAEAYNGFILEVSVNGSTIRVQMPQGVPHGLRNTVQVDNDDIAVTTLFHQSLYTFIGTDKALREAVVVNSEPGIVYRTKDLTLRHELSAKSLSTGTTVRLQDFLGESYNVRIPGGHTGGLQKIVVPDRGYVDWYSSHSQAGSTRGDVIITFVPTENVEATLLH